jgi:hypothetical protein
MIETSAARETINNSPNNNKSFLSWWPTGNESNNNGKCQSQRQQADARVTLEKLNQIATKVLRHVETSVAKGVEAGPAVNDEQMVIATVSHVCQKQIFWDL